MPCLDDRKTLFSASFLDLIIPWDARSLFLTGKQSRGPESALLWCCDNQKNELLTENVNTPLHQ